MHAMSYALYILAGSSLVSTWVLYKQWKEQRNHWDRKAIHDMLTTAEIRVLQSHISSATPEKVDRVLLEPADELERDYHDDIVIALALLSVQNLTIPWLKKWKMMLSQRPALAEMCKRDAPLAYERLCEVGLFGGAA